MDTKHIFPKKMMVTDRIGAEYERTVIADLGSEYTPRWVALNKQQSETVQQVSVWAFAREIIEYPLPVISGYNGTLRANNTEVKYGCKTASIPKLRKLLELETLSTNANIGRIMVDTTTISFQQIREILLHVDNLNLVNDFPTTHGY